ncbi:MAG: phosphatase PAP2 family protein [Steroidobacteraceae bacterium]|nr:phosphatase PAP2 family protein [Steroidobacteraceae bacterium]
MEPAEAARLATLADFAARHAVALLLGLVATLLAAAWSAWRLLGRQAPRLAGLVARTWHRVDRRRLVARWLGLHALASFVLAAAGCVAFVELAGELGAGEELAAFDLALAAALSHHLGERALAFFGAVTHLGDPALLWGIALAVAAVLAWRREWQLALAWSLVTGGGALLNRLLKSLFARTRPVPDHGYASADGFSFPSGHASGSLLVYGMLAYLVVRHTPPRWHLPVAVLALLLVVFVGASRVLLQVHWFSDVLAGWANGAAWAALCIGGLEVARLAGSPRRA